MKSSEVFCHISLGIIISTALYVTVESLLFSQYTLMQVCHKVVFNKVFLKLNKLLASISFCRLLFEILNSIHSFMFVGRVLRFVADPVQKSHAQAVF